MNPNRPFIVRLFEVIFIIIIGGCLVIIITPGGIIGPIGPDPDPRYTARFAALISLAAGVLGLKAVREHQLSQERL